AGYAASFEDCARCARTGPHPFLNVAAGGAVCAACRQGGSVSPAPETVALMAALLTGDWVTADASDPRHRREASGLVAAYLQ
ncbi:DNA repair protein RecO, partial [Shigella sonnei]|uniref:DNA repair protein RecO C-terminal domain-containing protein n=1 Tax=Shigella sonnei TaxID=624 RepID=UPI00149501DD|nr:DNA repair protein RecO [Shigella sonnei]